MRTEAAAPGARIEGTQVMLIDRLSFGTESTCCSSIRSLWCVSRSITACCSPYSGDSSGAGGSIRARAPHPSTPAPASPWVSSSRRLSPYTLGADLAWASATGFVALTLLHRRDTVLLWARIDWSLLLFFSGLLVVVEGFMRSVAPAWLFAALPVSPATTP